MIMYAGEGQNSLQAFQLSDNEHAVSYVQEDLGVSLQERKMISTSNLTPWAGV